MKFELTFAFSLCVTCILTAASMNFVDEMVRNRKRLKSNDVRLLFDQQPTVHYREMPATRSPHSGNRNELLTQQVKVEHSYATGCHQPSSTTDFKLATGSFFS